MRRLVVGGLSAATVAGTGAGLAALAGPAGATPTFSTTRLGGANRFATAALIATSTFKTADTVIIASGVPGHLPDSLASSYLAGQENGGAGAPVLLVNTDSVPTETSQALTTLGAKHCVIVGGTAAVTDGVATTLNGAGCTTSRVSGADRFATAEAVDSQTGMTKVGTGSGPSAGKKFAIVAGGPDANLVDSLGASPISFADSFPLLLVNGPSGTLSSTELGILHTDGITDVIIVGGTASVGSQVDSQLTGYTVHREAGSGRSATSQALADFAISNLGLVGTHFNVASGSQANLVDSLSGGPHGGTEKAPTLITNSSTDAGSVTAFATAHAATEASAHIFGGTAAVDSTVEAAIVAAAKAGGVSAVTARPQLLSAAVVSTDPVLGTTVAYTFSKPVLTATAADFKLYTAADSPAPGSSATVQTGGTVVNVVFSSLTTAASLTPYTLATVASGAATAAGGLVNPDGAVPFGTGTSAGTLTAGVTNAPNLTSVGNFRAGGGGTLVDFTFDKAPTVVTATGFHLVTTTNTVLDCTETKLTGDVVTATCPATVTAAGVARGYVDPGSVTGATSIKTPLESVNVTGTPPNTTGADLSRVTLSPSSTGQNSAVFTFAAPVVVTPAATDFTLFNQDGTTIVGTGTVTPNSATNPTAFQVNFGTGASLLSNVVGASVSAFGNVEPASFGVTGAGGGATTPGVVDAPQLSSVALTKGTDAFGNTTYTATYTFSQAVKAVVPGDFHLYQGDTTGTEITPPACVVSPTTATQVTCLATSSTSPTATSVGTTVLGTVDAGAVTGGTGTSGHANPEGAANTTGGTGTPAT